MAVRSNIYTTAPVTFVSAHTHTFMYCTCVQTHGQACTRTHHLSYTNTHRTTCTGLLLTPPPPQTQTHLPYTSMHKLFNCCLMSLYLPLVTNSSHQRISLPRMTSKVRIHHFFFLICALSGTEAFHCLCLPHLDSGFAEVKVDSFDINDNPPNLNKRPLYLRPGKNYILIR